MGKEYELYKITSDVEVEGLHILARSEYDALTMYIESLRELRSLENKKSVKLDIHLLEFFDISPSALEAIVKESRK